MAINLSKVSFAYGNFKKKTTPRYILKNIDLQIDGKDEFIMLLGESGAGKSTLVQLLNALLLATNGDVSVFDQNISKAKNIKLKNVRKKVGLVFQFPEYQLFDETVFKDVCFGPKNFGIADYEAKAKEALEVVGVSPELFERNPYMLSGGQMRKVAIAGILASNPDILVFDEPTVGLDPLGKKDLLELLKKLNTEHHKTIILITHDMDVVGEVGKRIVVLKQGKVAYDGCKDELFKNDNLMNEYCLDYPNTIKILKAIKKEFNVDLNELQYSIEDVYTELERVFGNE